MADDPWCFTYGALLQLTEQRAMEMIALWPLINMVVADSPKHWWRPPHLSSFLLPLLFPYFSSLFSYFSTHTPPILFITTPLISPLIHSHDSSSIPCISTLLLLLSFPLSSPNILSFLHITPPIIPPINIQSQSPIAI